MSAPSANEPGADGGEFELISRLATVLESDRPLPDVLVGIGDDCAVVARDGRADLYTTDTLVDGVHFRAGEIPWFDLGWKAVAVNLSDIAAMGGRPLHSLVTLGVPSEVSHGDLEEAYRGIAEITRRFGGAVIGGDVVRSPVLFVTVAMTGAAAVSAEQAASTPVEASSVAAQGDGGPAVRLPETAVLMLRSAARPGDQIAVTGWLGCSAGGVRALASRLGGDDAEHLKRELFAPEPRVKEGQLLVASGVRSAIDLSDGLVADLHKVCEASCVSATVMSEALPVHDELRRAFEGEWRDLALAGGEDYELLFTAPERLMEALLPVLEIPATVIGEIESVGSGGAEVRVIDGRGAPVHVEVGGWDHLRPRRANMPRRVSD